MNIIHNSSLASFPATYTSPANSKAAPTPTNTGTEQPFVSRQQNPASTPEQIKTALAQSGFDKPSNQFNGSFRNSQALKAYNQTLDQISQTQLENVISRVDYYA